MKKITLLTFLLVSYFGYSQTTLLSDDFESYTDFIITDIGDWITLDLDLLTTYTGGTVNDPGVDPTWPNAFAAMAFQIFNPSTTTPQVVNSSIPFSDPDNEVRNFDARSGDKYAAAWASPPGTPAANDDWLISPVVSLAASGNSVTFWVKAMSNTYGDEDYEVGVYTGTGTPTASSDFTIIATGSATYPDWEEINLPLNDYNDQDVRIGIHYIASDVYMLMVDDFDVTTTLSVDQFDQVHNYVISYLDNKITISNIVDKANYRIISINGQVVIDGSSRSDSETIDLSNLSSGIYVVEVSDGDNQRIQRKKIALLN